MTVATSNREPAAGRLRLPAAKGRELRGVLLLALGLLLGVALASHQPSDPSFLHQASGPRSPTANWIGAVGAQTSALGFGLFGLPSLAVPLLLLAAGWRRLRARAAERLVGRGLGAVILLAALPALCHLALGRVAWRSGELAAGGALGTLVAEFLERRLNLPGTFVVLVATVAFAAVLLVQTSLGETVGAWLGRVRAAWQALVLARARRREQRGKEKERRRIAEGHVAAALEGRKGRLRKEPREGEPAAEAGANLLDLPLRVVERRGEPDFGIRRVSAATSPSLTADEPASLPARERAAAGTPPVKVKRGAARPQPELPFSEVELLSPLPPVNLLQLADEGRSIDENELVRLSEVIRLRCAEFGVEGTIEGINPGPVITVYEFQPAPGVKVSQIVGLQDDLALALRAEAVRIDRLPGRSTLGIEVPNRERQIIRLGPLLSKDAFVRAPSPLTMAVGVTLHGEPYYADLAAMPHLLVAGATGSGKSVGLQSMITSILYKARRDEVQFIFIDPKRIELGVYADIPSLVTPVVVEPKQAAHVLAHLVEEMENRYRKLAQVHVRSIAHYNQAIRDPEHRKRLALAEGEGEIEAEDFQPLPYLVIIIDELADLMMVASADVETAIARLAQMARAVGIHLIVATQRPSVDVLTGTIKANFPCRISYATASRHDSRTILDQIGAEKLLGKGDMLFMPPGTSRVIRLHGAYVSEQETAALVRWMKKQGKPEYDLALLEPPEGERGLGEGGEADDDLYEEAARLVVAERMASASFLQRRMRIGFSRASRLIDLMARDGLLGPPQGSKPREVLVPRDYFEELDAARVGG